MRCLVLYSAIGLVLLAVGCTEQEPPQPYDENMAANSNDQLMPIAPMAPDPAILRPDAGALPEPVSADATPAEPGAGDGETDDNSS